MKFKELDKRPVSEVEEQISKSWGSINDMHNAQVEKYKDNETFVFYDGPAFANGFPGLHHMVSKNLKDTTTIEITPDMVSDSDDFKEFVEDEISNSLLRDTSEMVIIGSPREVRKKIVVDYNQSKDEHFYQGIIHANMIMGYFNQDLEFICNEKYAHGNDAFLDSFYESGRYM